MGRRPRPLPKVPPEQLDALAKAVDDWATGQLLMVFQREVTDMLRRKAESVRRLRKVVGEYSGDIQVTAGLFDKGFRLSKPEDWERVATAKRAPERPPRRQYEDLFTTVGQLRAVGYTVNAAAAFVAERIVPIWRRLETEAENLWIDALWDSQGPIRDDALFFRASAAERFVTLWDSDTLTSAASSAERCEALTTRLADAYRRACRARGNKRGKSPTTP